MVNVMLCVMRVSSYSSSSNLAATESNSHLSAGRALGCNSRRLQACATPPLYHLIAGHSAGRRAERSTDSETRSYPEYAQYY